MPVLDMILDTNATNNYVVDTKAGIFVEGKVYVDAESFEEAIKKVEEAGYQVKGIRLLD